MGVGRVLNDVKPYLAMILLQIGFAGMYIVAVASLKRGMSHFVLVVYRNIVATAVMAPFALYFERSIRPRMTLTIFLKIMGLALLEYVQIIYAGARSEPVLHGSEHDLRRLRVGADQRPPRRDIRHGAHPAHGEGAAAESAQPGQDRRHRLHRRRRGAHDPVPRPRGELPVVQGAAPRRRRRRPGRRRLLPHRDPHRHRRLRLLVGLLHPPGQHAAELPRRAVADGAHLLHGLAHERRRRARRRAPQHPCLGHRLRHPPLHRRLRWNSVFRRGLLRARYRVEAARPGVRHSLQPSVHDRNRRHGLHHTQRRDHTRKRDRRSDHRGRPVHLHLGQEQGPRQPSHRRLRFRRLQGRRRAAHHLTAAQRQRQARARQHPRPRLRRRDAGDQRRRPLLVLTYYSKSIRRLHGDARQRSR